MRWNTNVEKTQGPFLQGKMPENIGRTPLNLTFWDINC